MRSVYYPSSRIPVVNPSDIADAFSDFYQSLYNIKNDQSILQPNPLTIQTFLDSVNLPALSTSQIQTLSKSFSPSEVKLASKTLPLKKKKKSPGADGYTNEYYKQFAPIVSLHLSDLFNHAASSGTLPNHMLQSVITTIPKPGKDPQEVQNYRPISLINTVVK